MADEAGAETPVVDPVVATSESIKWARERILRNVAVAVHHAMWIRGVSEDELLTMLGKRWPRERLHQLLLAQDCGMRITEFSDILFVLDCKIKIELVPNES